MNKILNQWKLIFKKKSNEGKVDQVYRNQTKKHKYGHQEHENKIYLKTIQKVEQITAK